MNSGGQSVSEVAHQCLARFDKLLLKPALAHNQWAENRRADFNLWVDSVGAMARKKASLDARFASRERELALAKSLLVNLCNYLDDCLSLDEEYSLMEAKLDVDAAIDNLASIAVAIRQTGRKSRLLKADKSLDYAILGDLEAYLKCVALIRPTLPDEVSSRDKEEDPHWWKEHERDPLWWQKEIRGDLSPLQQRLIEANLRRRNRFLYAQVHSRHLARVGPPSACPSDTETDTPHVLEVLKTGGPAEKEGILSEPPKVDIQKSTSSRAALTSSETSASVPESTLKWEKPENSARVPKSQITAIAGGIEYPRLAGHRKSASEGIDQQSLEQCKILKCPCCCESLPNSILRLEAWKNHLTLDICPYTCIAEDCPLPHVLYRTRADWEDHLKKDHPKKWKCQLCKISGATLFSSVDQLVEHVRVEHVDSFPKELLGSVPLWPSIRSIGLNICPLCRSTGPRDALDLIKHVLEHTHDFALRSLPWADLSPKLIRASTTSHLFDLSCLQSAEPSEPGASIVSWRMYLWFEKLEIPESKQWERSTGLLESRKATDTTVQPNYFAVNDYFASETEGLSIATPSDRSVDSLSLKANSKEEATEELPFLATPSRIPAFLGSSMQDIDFNFQELTWAERDRVLEGLRNEQEEDFKWGAFKQANAEEKGVMDRFINIRPWNYNRIRLQVPANELDYVNASEIVLTSPSDPSQEPLRYIAMQGPTLPSIEYVWRMIAEQVLSPAVIVQLTTMCEGGVIKCDPYFPDNEYQPRLVLNEHDVWGDGWQAEVTYDSYEELADGAIEKRKLLLQLKDEDEPRVVWHLLYRLWPDMGVPELEDLDGFFELIRLSQELSTATSPRIIHCSAGVGRTGTFITLEHLMRELELGTFQNYDEPTEGPDLVFETVNSLREQRVGMVQGRPQFLFIYQVMRKLWQDKYGVDEEGSEPAAKRFEVGDPFVDDSSNPS